MKPKPLTLADARRQIASLKREIVATRRRLVNEIIAVERDRRALLGVPLDTGGDGVKRECESCGRRMVKASRDLAKPDEWICPECVYRERDEALDALDAVADAVSAPANVEKPTEGA